MMKYYRLASHDHQTKRWKWITTPLTSLQAVFQVLRIYAALPQDRIRIFTASSKEDLSEMRLPRFRRVREEKSGKLYRGGYHGKTTTKLYEGIKTRGSTACRNQLRRVNQQEPVILGYQIVL
jgi:hypothetical protein